jgi:hypothetical protein
MLNWRNAAALAAGVALVGSATLLAQGERKLNDTEKKELQAIVKALDAPGGQVASNELGLAWVHNDLLKAQGNSQYVPFTVSLDPGKATTKTVSLYWRVVAKNAPPPPPPPAEKAPAEKDDKNKKKSRFAYEDLTTVNLEGSAPNNVSRSFTVPAGAYDVIVVAKEQPSKDKKAAPKVAMIQQQVEIPDLWNGELTTSSVIVAKSIEPLSTPLTQQQQTERPYAMGAMEIVPALTTKFTKASELSTFVLIYNAKTDPTNKPDVTVEYNFYAKQGGAEKFFNKTNPQSLNAQTLPPGFDFAAGHQLQSGQAVPLSSFPEGEYRLEIKVTDKLASKTITRDVNFSVAGS